MTIEHSEYVAQRTREAQADPRTVHELISLALTESDDEVGWDYVVTLHFRGTREVFDAARQLCVSDCAQERMLGANILSQLGVPDRTFPKEAVALLVELLEFETEPDALQAICTALGHLHEEEAIPSLARLSAHPSDEVRFAVALGLHCFEDPLAIETLIELSRDSDNAVRDWATFGLGSMIDSNTPSIRSALIERISDEDEVVRGEALVGLARRKDERVIEPLFQELGRYHNSEYGSFCLEAAEELANHRLLPVLCRLKKSSRTDEEKFDAAIRRCSGMNDQ